MAQKIIFITGTDTGVGKTVLTACLVEYLRQTGVDALAMKPFCSGNRDDVELLQSIQESRLPDDVINPFYFIDAVAPLVAARKAALKITLGCSGNPPLYCPQDFVTREQMAAFLIRALGEFNPAKDVPQRFADVGPENPFYGFIEQMAVRRITLGCRQEGSNLFYCPKDQVTRGQMAAFLVRAFGL